MLKKLTRSTSISDVVAAAAAEFVIICSEMCKKKRFRKKDSDLEVFQKILSLHST